jgi:chemotaxis protein MotB
MTRMFAAQKAKLNRNAQNPNLQPAIKGSGPAAGKDMLRRLESLENELASSMSYTGNARWMIPYADLLTILLGLFVVLLSLSQLDKRSLEAYSRQIQQTLHLKQREIVAQKETLSRLQRKLVKLESIAIIPAEAPEPLSEDGKGIMAARNISNGIQVSQQERGLVITLMDGVLFASGSADLSANSKRTLDQLAEILKAEPHSIRVEGHTDDSPIATSQFPSNWELSTARATCIVQYFVEAHGFEPSRLSAAGYGEYHPVDSNSSIKGKQKNRRVDIVVLNNQAAQLEPETSIQGKRTERGN